MADEANTAKSWSAARATGAEYYFTGKPCKHGHVTQRYANNGGCVECAHTWHKRNPEKFKSIQKRCRKKNKDKRIAYMASRKEKTKEWNRQYQVENRERLNVNSNRWYWANKDLIRERNSSVYRGKVITSRRNRKARKKNADGRHTSEDISVINKAQRGKCAYCKKKLANKYHVDHIVALINGGTNWPNNLQLLCPRCNLRKHAKDPIDFAQSQGMLL